MDKAIRKWANPFKTHGWKRFSKNKLALAGAALLLALTGMAVFAPFIVGNDPYLSLTGADGQIMKNLSPGDSGLLLGADSLGRDIFSRVVYAARVSLSVGLVAVGISAAVGIILGAVAGYFGKWADIIIMRVVDVVYCFPVMFLVIIIATILKPSIYNVMIVIGLCNWTGTARFVRGEILRVRELEYVQASVSLGAANGRVILQHILPNITAPIIVEATLQMARAILTEASLSYLGVGVQMPTASWGNMLMDANNIATLTLRPWQWVPPGVCILLAVLSINFIGDGLRDAFDARQKK
ncbi:MAG: ABC transporter permease [Clostridiales bacterium]|jgi:peptide/nickel transport system permease protein|nr:ABC transporter permease [Clostridiales bacterium]